MLSEVISLLQAWSVIPERTWICPRALIVIIREQGRLYNLHDMHRNDGCYSSWCEAGDALSMMLHRDVVISYSAEEICRYVSKRVTQYLGQEEAGRE